MSLLDELKKQAQAKQSRDQVDKQRQAELEARSRDEVLPKLVQIYSYLNDLIKQIEIIKPDVKVNYNLKGYGNLTHLLQDGYELRADSRDNMTNLILGFYCHSDKKVKFQVETRQQVEQQKDYFRQHEIAYSSRDFRDERHEITHAQFSFEPRIRVTMEFQLASDLATIMLIVRNYDGLGINRYQLEPARIDEDFLDELGKYILRRENEFLKLDISEDFRENIRQRLEKDKKGKKRKISNITYLSFKRNDDQSQEIEISKVPIVEDDSSIELAAEEILQEESKAADRLSEQKVYTHFANLPTPIKEATKSELDKVAYADRLKQLRNFPDRLFQTAAQILSAQNRSVIKPNKRLELVSAVIGQVYPVIADTIEKYRQQKHSLPENHTRREVLLAAISMAEQISITYKHVFKSDVEEATDKNRERITMCVFRILEMTRIEQRLRALRYQKLTSTSWEDCNKLFFYIIEHADIDKEYKLLGAASRWVKPKATDYRGVPSCSIKKLYLSIQLFGVLDVTTWPVWLFQVSDQYLGYIEDGLRLIPDHGQDVVEGWLISSINHNAQAAFNRNEGMKSPSIIIDYSAMYNFLVEEHGILTKNRVLEDYDESSLSEPLRSIHKYDRVPVLETILLSLRKRERHQKRHAAIGSEVFQVYFGFEESYRLLSDLAHLDKSELKEMRDFVDTLAGKSSIVLDEEQGGFDGWEMINFSSGGLLLATEESDFTTPIEIGQVVTFTPAEKDSPPLLGCITRVQRSNYRNVELAIFRISTHAEAVLVVSTEQNANKGLPVILMRDMDKKWKVLIPNQYGMVTGTPLKVIRADGKKIPARLGSLWLVKNKFTIFELSSPQLTVD
ncbi:MAG: hypothetical protein OEY52_07400 [Gammaproteobacteria bacterium]|nr:hypothetical protein [Gammaproteobacteria bacterium]